jgi:hypothetical protein
MNAIRKRRINRPFILSDYFRSFIAVVVGAKVARAKEKPPDRLGSRACFEK